MTFLKQKFSPRDYSKVDDDDNDEDIYDDDEDDDNDDDEDDDDDDDNDNQLDVLLNSYLAECVVILV